MKEIIFALVVVLAITGLQKTAAQPVPPGRDDSTQQYQLSRLLFHYYNVKDALVAGSSKDASARAEEFIRTANSIDYKLISEGNINALLKDVTPISESRDIKIQREHFSNFSSNMATLAKAMKPGSQPIYQVYCPMKKAGWLSSEKEIKNPYYGTAMLNCGKIVETIVQ